MKILKLSLFALASLGLAGGAQALNLSPETPDWRKIGTGPEVVGPEDFYKAESDPADEKGPFADLFSAEFSSSFDTATISYSGSQALWVDSVWVKGGRSLIFFDLSSSPWNGVDDLVVSNTYLYQQGGPPPPNVITQFPPLDQDSTPPAISHVSLDGEFHDIPDSGASLALLGLGLLALAAAKRRLS